MSNLPNCFKTFQAQLIHVLVVPFSFFGFMVVYRPFNIEHHLNIGGYSFGLHILQISCAILVSTLLMRILYYFLRHRIGKITYFFWVIGEMLISSIFVAYYLWYIKDGQIIFLKELSYAVLWVACVTIFPYVIATLAFFLDDECQKNNRNNEPANIRFYDERKNLKFVVSPQSVLYIAAEENYVNIFYLEHDQLQNYLLRSSMKSIENICTEHGLLRCHRSYYVNPAHIQAVRRERDGSVLAQMDVTDVQDIPVTKRYYDALLDHI